MVLRTVAMDRELMYTLSPHLKTSPSGHRASVARMQVDPCPTCLSTPKVSQVLSKNSPS